MTKVRVRSGNVELEFEGDDVPALADIVDMLRKLESYGATATDIAHRSNQDGPPSGRVALPVAVGPDDLGSNLSGNESVTSIATRLQVQTATDLVIAASVFLHICQKQADYTRRDILTAMQSDRMFYTANHSACLSQSLKRLMKKGELTLRRDGHFMLTARALEAIKLHLLETA